MHFQGSVVLQYMSTMCDEVRAIDIFITLNNIFNKYVLIFIFMCIGVFPACLCLPYVCSAPEARRHRIPSNWNYSGFHPPCGSENQIQVLERNNQSSLTTEPSLYPLLIISSWYISRYTLYYHQG